MSFAHSSSSKVLVNEDHHSGSITSYSVTHTRELSPTTVLTDSGMRYIPGQLDGSLKLKGLFDSAAGGLYEEVNALVGTDNSMLVTVYPDAFTLGQPAFITVCDPKDFKVDASVSEAVTIEVDGQPDDGVDWGVSLHAHGAETADVNGTGVDNAAASANGGVAALHVTAYATLANAVIKVQHSTDNSSWADLVTHTTVTGVTHERVLVAAGTTVNRYLRAFLDVTGSGSVTYALAFARR